jgi:pseudouridine synthase
MPRPISRRPIKSPRMVGACAVQAGCLFAQSGRTVDARGQGKRGRSRSARSATSNRSSVNALRWMASRQSRQMSMCVQQTARVVVSAIDERGRDTVYALARGGFALAWAGRATGQGQRRLCCLSNDTTWAAGITDPVTTWTRPITCRSPGIPDDSVLIGDARHRVSTSRDLLKAKRAVAAARRRKNAWLEVVLDEGRNRHIRRLLEAHWAFDVLRLIRVAIGNWLGDLAKGQWRQLSDKKSVVGIHART